MWEMKVGRTLKIAVEAFYHVPTTQYSVPKLVIIRLVRLTRLHTEKGKSTRSNSYTEYFVVPTSMLLRTTEGTQVGTLGKQPPT